MKKLICGFSLLIGCFAQANFLGARYSSEQLRFENRCSIQICRANDNGQGFIKYCAFQHGSYVPGTDIPVYVWHEQQSKCYCPCDYDFENQVSPMR